MAETIQAAPLSAMEETLLRHQAQKLVDFCRENATWGAGLPQAQMDLRLLATLDAERARVDAAERRLKGAEWERDDFVGDAMPLLEWAQRNSLKMGLLGGESLFAGVLAYVQGLERERDEAHRDLELLQLSTRWHLLPNFLETFDELRAAGYANPQTEAEIVAALPFDIAGYPPFKPFVRPQDSKDWCKYAESETVLVKLGADSYVSARWTWCNYSNVAFKWESSSFPHLMVRRVLAWQRLPHTD